MSCTGAVCGSSDEDRAKSLQGKHLHRRNLKRGKRNAAAASASPGYVAVEGNDVSQLAADDGNVSQLAAHGGNDLRTLQFMSDVSSNDVFSSVLHEYELEALRSTGRLSEPRDAPRDLNPLYPDPFPDGGCQICVGVYGVLYSGIKRQSVTCDYCEMYLRLEQIVEHVKSSKHKKKCNSYCEITNTEYSGLLERGLQIPSIHIGMSIEHELRVRKQIARANALVPVSAHTSSITSSSGDPVFLLTRALERTRTAESEALAAAQHSLTTHGECLNMLTCVV